MRIPCLPERFLTDAFPVLKMMGVSKVFDTPIIGLRRGRRSLLLRESEHGSSREDCPASRRWVRAI